ncbi:hypothetical protein J1614_011415 [Plenodomus biglobosus]|nr:hypothetical protein J1614_011415 [Plenodomus biglobosus]
MTTLLNSFTTEPTSPSPQHGNHDAYTARKSKDMEDTSRRFTAEELTTQLFTQVLYTIRLLALTAKLQPATNPTPEAKAPAAVHLQRWRSLGNQTDYIVENDCEWQASCTTYHNRCGTLCTYHDCRVLCVNGMVSKEQSRHVRTVLFAPIRLRLGTHGYVVSLGRLAPPPTVRTPPSPHHTTPPNKPTSQQPRSETPKLPFLSQHLPSNIPQP